MDGRRHFGMSGAVVTAAVLESVSGSPSGRVGRVAPPSAARGVHNSPRPGLEPGIRGPAPPAEAPLSARGPWSSSGWC